MSRKCDKNWPMKQSFSSSGSTSPLATFFLALKKCPATQWASDHLWKFKWKYVLVVGYVVNFLYFILVLSRLIWMDASLRWIINMSKRKTVKKLLFYIYYKKNVNTIISFIFTYEENIRRTLFVSNSNINSQTSDGRLLTQLCNVQDAFETYRVNRNSRLERHK